ncbi:hypothetical protein PISMIDRAFT_409290 [Pisolithus microcarpus 441]|uniref:Uncharacterized protein n=1 Tax=Pisolithus microcarpus 441 TaxID=765257 RepID=A0A0C9ZXN4_9AGAM|nr:hypothetical protein PISMIDRAFT_409290 [Pisolithus microcarpus 441]
MPRSGFGVRSQFSMLPPRILGRPPKSLFGGLVPLRPTHLAVFTDSPIARCCPSDVFPKTLHCSFSPQDSCTRGESSPDMEYTVSPRSCPTTLLVKQPK